MPAGLAFLNVKSWHPANYQNQKKIWIAEHKHAEREKREAEAAAQLAREADAYHHEEMMKRKGGGSHMGMLATDQEKKNESASMAFLYAKPPGIAETAPLEAAGVDDDAVKEFYRKQNLRKKRDPGFSMHSQVTTLEKMTGKKKPTELTIEEQVERFPFLKDAPIEGDYARDVKLNFKPFNKQVQNVRCLRCGEWGHRSGDRECKLKDFNPHDAARQQREDPMTYMKQDLVLEKQNLVLKLAALPREMAINMAEKHNQVVLDDDDDGLVMGDENYDDVDEEFLAKLSTKEKKLLLKRLKKGMKASSSSTLQGGGETEERSSSRRKKKKKKKKQKKSSSSAREKKRKRSSSSSSSCSSSEDEDDGDRGGKKKRQDT